MNVKKIEMILNMVKDAEISAMKFEDSEISLTVKKTHTKQPTIPETNNSQPENPSQQPQIQESETPVTMVKSEGVGILTHHIKPDQRGKVIKKGTVLFTIRAMNIEHEVKAQSDCKIKDYLVDNGSPVEYGQAIVNVHEL